MLFFGGFSLCGGRGLATLLLFLYVTEEAGRKCVRVMPWPLCGRMQYDYKQTNLVDVQSLENGAPDKSKPTFQNSRQFS